MLPMFIIRPIKANEWAAYRAVRLRALQDSPNAFGSTYDAESSGSDQHWADRLQTLETSGRDRALVSETSDGFCGLAWCKISAVETSQANIYQMWVAPEVRGQGIGRRLLTGALNWAVGAGVRRVVLGVTVSDSPAWRLYVSMGFRPVGQPQPLREGSIVQAQTMEWPPGDA